MQDFFMNLNKKQKIIIAVIVAIIVILIFIFTYRYFYAEDGQLVYDNETLSENVVEEIEESSILLGTSKTKIIAHVIGEVNTPGVVTLNEGARIIDAINSAGGKTEDADLSKINLAYIVEDGVQIYVPRIGEKRDEYIMESAGEGVIEDSAILDDSEKKGIKVNINTASEEKLQTLPGVGLTTAQKIINYRNENGKFKTIEDLKNVPGIGESKYNNLKDQITVK